MNKVLVIGLVGLVLVAVFFGVFEQPKTFEQEREDTMSQLYSSIEHAEEMGKYKCCIEPPCTMCYLGSWIWKDGTCKCDEMIANGEMDKVCPQCVKGIEQGMCTSQQSEVCQVTVV